MAASAPVLLLLLAASPAVAAGNKVSPVQKVIQLIDDMATKVKKEDDELIAGFEEYAKFCDDEATQKGYAIKDSKEEIEELSATVIDSKATVDTSAAEVSDLS